MTVAVGKSNAIVLILNAFAVRKVATAINVFMYDTPVLTIKMVFPHLKTNGSDDLLVIYHGSTKLHNIRTQPTTMKLERTNPLPMLLLLQHLPAQLNPPTMSTVTPP